MAGRSAFTRSGAVGGAGAAQTLGELEAEVERRSNALTEEVRELKRITERTKEVADTSAATLHAQGEQMDRIHLRVEQASDSLQVGKNLLGKLGNPLYFGGARGKVKGPQAYEDDSRKPEDSLSRAALKLDEKERGKIRPIREGLTVLEKVELDKQEQEDILDDVSANLDHMTLQAKMMGDELRRQNAKLDDLNSDVGALGADVKGAVRKGNQVLRKW